MLVYEQLPDANPLKKSAAAYVTQYEKRFGTRSTFGGHAWDARRGAICANDPRAKYPATQMPHDPNAS